jgi:hypothetical protein
MSDEALTESTPRRAASAGRLTLLAIIVVIGALTLTAVIFVVRDRLHSTIASNSADTSSATLGLTADGYLRAGAPQGKTTPVAEIAADLLAKAFTFTPKDFDAQVAAAKKSMTVTMQQQYAQQLSQQSTRALVTGGLSMTTTLVHYKGDAKNYAYLGVVSLTETSGEFLMLFQRSTTTSGSRQAQVTPFMLDVTVGRIGNTWMLSAVKGI